jgi:hypothetical protein
VSRYATHAPRASTSSVRCDRLLWQIPKTGGREQQSTPPLPLVEGCDHNYPILVKAVEEGKHRCRRTQCLGCKKLGPAHEDYDSAWQALLLLATRQSG